MFTLTLKKSDLKSKNLKSCQVYFCSEINLKLHLCEHALNKVLHDKVFNEKSYIDYSKTKHFNSKWDFVLFVNVLTGNNFKSFREAFNCLKFINEEYRCLNLGYYANANSSVWTTSMSLL